MEDQGEFLWDVEEKLLSVGVHELFIADVPTPKQYRTHPLSAEEGWLIILGTGFDKTPHVPISDELTQRGEVLRTEEPAAWWSMRKFTYPHPKVWLA
ncbi:unnamed protein product [Rhizoctonia solani]|uniref:Uncharacterized protein n=1 Tax=Rhizoctonia solani TaxID=456999 RepID=A0A8H3CD04_9AGAM|nr:unnamed protein product [Rhizoctonia solani]